ncbi:MAG: hypothetical protein OER88_02620, partial [Planctomycetota bacterium]|nr:hypothetical protein [Planctomycetota bacterium]
MADRVKYFVLGVLFLVVAGVIAFDRWNSPQDSTPVADRGDEDDGSFKLVVGPAKQPILDD